ncbi:Helix-turn-helix [uncultured archaeon]|nr:Helix-turn-helix [uncultured archaeon]
MKDNLVEDIRRVFTDSGYRVMDCIGARSCFDVAASKRGRKYLVKVMANAEGFNPEAAYTLRHLADMISATPVLVSNHIKNGPLSDGVVYDRYGVSLLSARSLSEALKESFPATHAVRGGYLTFIDSERMITLRQRHGITQSALAEAVGVTKQSVYRYERTGRVSLDVAKRLNSYFGEDLISEGQQIKVDSDDGDFAAPSLRVSSLTHRVLSIFDTLGLEAEATNAPFDVVASFEDETIFTMVSNDWRRMEQRAQMVDELSEMLGGFSVCVSSRNLSLRMAVVHPDELERIRNRQDLIDLLE